MELSTIERITQLRFAGRVQRAHIIPHHGSYSDAEHQWNVAILLFLLWPLDWANLGLIALTHDVPEGWTGDIPSNVAKLLDIRCSGLETKLLDIFDLPSMHRLSEVDQAKIKACDLLELYLWCREEVAHGNRSMTMDVIREIELYVREKPLPEPAMALWHKLFVSPLDPPTGPSFLRRILNEP